MTTFTEHGSILGSSLFDTFAGASRNLHDRLAGWAAHRREVARIERELNTYTDRQLRELSLFRSDIPSVARGTYRR